MKPKQSDRLSKYETRKERKDEAKSLRIIERMYIAQNQTASLRQVEKGDVLFEVLLRVTESDVEVGRLPIRRIQGPTAIR